VETFPAARTLRSLDLDPTVIQVGEHPPIILVDECVLNGAVHQLRKGHALAGVEAPAGGPATR
jgi:hypothetical protein